MEPAEFDAALTELQSQVDAVLDVIARYPEVAREVRAALDNHADRAELSRAAQNRRARLNALTQTVSRFRETGQ